MTTPGTANSEFTPIAVEVYLENSGNFQARVLSAPTAPNVSSSAPPTDASTGTLTLWMKGGAHMAFPGASIEALKTINLHVEQHGFVGWLACVFACQSLALNMAEMTAVHFDAHPGRVRLVA